MSLNVPSSGDISYNGTPPGSIYGPYTEKSVMFQRFLTLANQNPSLVSVEVVGHGFPKSGSGTGWDEVIFKVGNPNGGRVLWDSFIHGLEDFGVEALFAIYKWLLTPNTNPTQEARRQRILSNNYVAFFPFLNWRFSRMNYNYAAVVGNCSGSDTDGDDGPLGVNLARDFRTGRSISCPDNWAPPIPPGPYTQPETQALVTAWNLWRDATRGWFYVNLHMGLTSRSGGGAMADQAVSLRSSIYTELFGGSPTWSIGTGGASHAAGDAVQYFGASGGFELELGGTNWQRTSAEYTSLTSGTTYKELLSLFAAQCQLVEGALPDTYNLTIQTGVGGTTNPVAGTYTYNAGATSNPVTATPNSGYTFSYWLINGSQQSTSNPISIVMNDNIVIQPIFAPIGQTYTLTVSLIGNGTTTPAPGMYTYDANLSVSLIAMPASNSLFSRWIINGVSYYSAIVEVVMQTNVTAEARFFRPQLTIIAATIGGTTNPPAGAQPPVDKGTTMSVTAIPDLDYQFDHWIIDTSGTSTANPLNITMDNSHTIQPVFNLIQGVNLTVNSQPTGIPFTLDGQSKTTDLINEPVSIGTHMIIMPQSVQFGTTYYTFKQWEDGTTAFSRTINVVTNMTITATYEETVIPPYGGLETIGVNYLSRGNHYDEVNASPNVVEEDFARFAGDKIRFVSIRIVWKAVETARGVYDDSILVNTAAVIDIAAAHGISCNVDFWTHFQDPSQQTEANWIPQYVRDRNAGNSSAAMYLVIRDAVTKQDWFNYVGHCVNYLKSKANLSGWTILNEPFYGGTGAQSTDRANFETFFQEAYNVIKGLDSSRIVGCRFTLSFSAGGSTLHPQKFSDSTIDIFDVYGVNIYLDVANPSDTKYNSDWGMWYSLSPKLAAKAKICWLYEFGQNSTNQEVNRKFYADALAYYNGGLAGQGTNIPGFPKRIWAWAWQHNNATAESYNIYTGTAPTPAYYELVKYAAQIVPEPRYLTIATGPNGTTYPAPGQYSYEDLAIVQVTAIPNDGYRLAKWTLDGVDRIENPISMSMNVDHSLMAIFEAVPSPPPQKRYLTIVAVNSQTNPTPNTYEVDLGSTISVTVTPNSGYKFKEWLLDNVSVGTSPSYTVLMDTNHTLIAVSEEIPQPVTHTLFISTTAGGTTYPIPGTYDFTEGTVTGVVPIPDNGYRFRNWTLDGQTRTDNPINITMDADHSLIAFFELSPPQKRYLTIVAVNGQTNPVQGTYEYDLNSSVPVTATPNSGYRFKQWLLDNLPAGTQPLITVTMDINHIVVAVFEEIKQAGFPLWLIPAAIVGIGITYLATKNQIASEKR